MNHMIHAAYGTTLHSTCSSASILILWQRRYESARLSRGYPSEKSAANLQSKPCVQLLLAAVFSRYLLSIFVSIYLIHSNMTASLRSAS
ncbi:uncharacterized protein B0H18DRAFT_984884, partial [Fomitopsis serialis]|uniref:uncharacterized protein n=1 Tax=Fomitopsis serialis TaxID=139415 RepID=UPI002008C5BC